MSTARKRSSSPHQPTGTWCRPAKRLAIYLRDSFRCAYCCRSLRKAKPADVTLDHLVCRSRGGSNAASNLVTACRRCNSKRRSLPWRRFAGARAPRIARQVVAPLNMALAKDIIADRRRAAA